jgi:hypothetical protein
MPPSDIWFIVKAAAIMEFWVEELTALFATAGSYGLAEARIF